MNEDELLSAGFFLAMEVCGSLGVNFNRDGERVDANSIINRLAEVARGEVSLYNNEEEEFAEAQRNRGGQPAEGEREWFAQQFANRAMYDQLNRQAAVKIMREISRGNPPAGFQAPAE